MLRYKATTCLHRAAPDAKLALLNSQLTVVVAAGSYVTCVVEGERNEAWSSSMDNTLGRNKSIAAHI